MQSALPQAHRVAASHGLAWIKAGFQLFRKNPFMWILLFIIYLLIGMLLSKVPVIGPVVLNLLAPVFVAGFMAGCKALDTQQDLLINHLFEGFKKNTPALVTIGGLYLLAIIVIVAIMFASVDHSTFKAIFSGEKISEMQVEAMEKNGFYFTVLFAMLLTIPLMMAYWFAPVLAAFYDLSALDALKMSFKASWLNIPAFLVYSLVAMVLIVLAMIPFGLGMVVMIPTMTASLYTSYKDIFAVTPEVSVTPE